MTSWQLVRLFAGTFVLLSLALGIPGSPLFVSPWWLAFTAFVGANLLQSAFTRWCLMESIVRKLGARYLFHDSPDYPEGLARLENPPPILTVPSRSRISDSLVWRISRKPSRPSPTRTTNTAGIQCWRW